MTRIELSVQLSDEELDWIADAVANRLRGLLKDRPRLVYGDMMLASLGVCNATFVGRGGSSHA